MEKNCLQQRLCNWQQTARHIDFGWKMCHSFDNMHNKKGGVHTSTARDGFAFIFNINNVGNKSIHKIYMSANYYF